MGGANFVLCGIIIFLKSTTLCSLFFFAKKILDIDRVLNFNKIDLFQDIMNFVKKMILMLKTFCALPLVGVEPSIGHL
jgi:hypothetical protein